jgi:hypothetical protein
MEDTPVTNIFRIASALEVALVCCEGVFPESQGILQIAGNHIAQLGAVFGASFAIGELRPLLDPVVETVRWVLEHLKRK